MKLRKLLLGATFGLTLSVIGQFNPFQINTTVQAASWSDLEYAEETWETENKEPLPLQFAPIRIIGENDDTVLYAPVDKVNDDSYSTTIFDLGLSDDTAKTLTLADAINKYGKIQNAIKMVPLAYQNFWYYSNGLWTAQELGNSISNEKLRKIVLGGDEPTDATLAPLANYSIDTTKTQVYLNKNFVDLLQPADYNLMPPYAAPVDVYFKPNTATMTIHYRDSNGAPVQAVVQNGTLKSDITIHGTDQSFDQNSTLTPKIAGYTLDQSTAKFAFNGTENQEVTVLYTPEKVQKKVTIHYVLPEGATVTAPADVAVSGYVGDEAQIITTPTLEGYTPDQTEVAVDFDQVTDGATFNVTYQKDTAPSKPTPPVTVTPPTQPVQPNQPGSDYTMTKQSGAVQPETGIPTYHDRTTIRETGSLLVAGTKVAYDQIIKDKTGQIVSYGIPGMYNTHTYIKASDVSKIMAIHVAKTDEIVYSNYQPVPIYQDPALTQETTIPLSTHFESWTVISTAKDENGQPLAYQLGDQQWVKAKDLVPEKVLNGTFGTTANTQLYNQFGQKTGTISNTDAYQVFAVRYINGHQALKLGDDTQWIYSENGAYYPTL